MEIAFKGKEAVYNYHLTVPYRPIVADPRKSVGEGELEGNLVIHGDNLHALKALMPRYAGKIDCIFIDPPYNTGNEGWSYNDAVNSPPAKDWLRQVVDRDDLLRHDKWCSMLWPRLRLLWELLSDSGSLWITLDDNEVAHARMMLDEIFGEQNFVATIIWHKIFSPKNSAQFFSEDHDYVLCYAKSTQVWRPNLLPRTDEAISRYANPDGDPRGVWTSGDLSARNFYGEGTYAVTTPSGRVITGPPTGTYWRVSKQKLAELDADTRIWWGDDGSNTPRLKRFLSEVKDGVVPQTIWHYEDVGHTQDAKKELLEVMDFASSEEVFVTPKPVDLISRILRIATKPDSLVLDSFAGSGTTGHSVLSLNAKDGGNRKFILVECEDYADSLTAERVRRVINGYPFDGTQRETLLERNITWTDLKRVDQIVKVAETIQSERQFDFDKVRAEVKDGKLHVIGERTIKGRVPGLGGSFSFCTLGDPLDLDQMLVGAGLPSWAEVAAWLFHTATGATIPSANLAQGVGVDEWYVAESPTHHVWTIYRPSADFLRSPAAALSLDLAKRIGERRNGKQHLVFAPFRFVSTSQLRPLGVEYAMLPFSLNRVERD